MADQLDAGLALSGGGYRAMLFNLTRYVLRRRKGETFKQLLARDLVSATIDDVYVDDVNASQN